MPLLLPSTLCLQRWQLPLCTEDGGKAPLPHLGPENPRSNCSLGLECYVSGNDLSSTANKPLVNKLLRYNQRNLELVEHLLCAMCWVPALDICPFQLCTGQCCFLCLSFSHTCLGVLCTLPNQAQITPHGEALLEATRKVAFPLSVVIKSLCKPFVALGQHDSPACLSTGVGAPSGQEPMYFWIFRCSED